MKKQFVPVLLLCLIPISALALTLYCLETYDQVVHNESGLLVCGYSLLAFLICTCIWLRVRKSNRHLTAIWFLAAAVLVFVFYMGTKIPFCVVCDQVTAEDLGFLIHWIQPESYSP